MAVVRELFREYAAWLQVDYCLQDFETELAGLPGVYAAPRGGIWLARADSMVAGGVAVRPTGDRVCEMKRLWVRPSYRGRQIGRHLAAAALEGARAAGHRRMTLETLDFMTAAQGLYASFGFCAVADTAVPANVRRLECDLTAAVPA